MLHCVMQWFVAMFMKFLWTWLLNIISEINTLYDKYVTLCSSVIFHKSDKMFVGIVITFLLKRRMLSHNRH
jgi:hypothetical protein